MSPIEELIVRLRTALEFYAEEDRYEYDETCCPPRRVSYKGADILSDNGETARDALKALASLPENGRADNG